MRLKKQTWFLALAATAALAVAAGLVALKVAPSSDYVRGQTDFEIMSTEGRLITFTDAQDEGERARDAALARLRAIEKALNRYDASSEVSAVNRAAGGAESVMVSETTARAVSEAKRFHQLTGGVFNPLVGSLVAVWKRAAAEGRLPSDEETGAALGLLNCQEIVVLEPPSPPAGPGKWFKCRLGKAGMQLDLGGMAKGWAADEALKEIRRCGGVHAAMVMLGGDGACWSEPGWSRPWTLGVQDPRRPDSREPIVKFLMTNGAAVTSGNYYRYYEIGGKRYSHIFDPRSGRPIENPVASATAIHPDGGTADALATACTVLGVKEGLALLERTAGAEGLILEFSDGRLVRHATKGFVQYEAPGDAGR
jgi:thiamine biosynthesis lipoprotein